MTTAVPAPPATGDEPGDESRSEFDTFYRDVAPRIAGTLRLLGCSPPEAEDAVQEAMIHMLQAWPAQLARTSQERVAYVRQRAIWSARDVSRRRGRMQRLLHRVWQREPDQPVEGLIVDAGTAGDIARLIQRLPERQRWVLILTYHDYPIAQIAATMGIQPSTVRGHLAAARTALRRHLEHGPGEGRQPR